MKKVRKTFKIFKFKELCEDAKQKVLEHFAEINVDYDWWDFLEDGFLEDMKVKYGIDAKGIYFDLYENTIALDKPCFISTNKFLRKAKIDVFADKTEEFELYLATNSSLRNHKTEVNVRNEQYDDVNDELTDFLDKILYDFLKKLREDYEYLTSEKGIIETIECNDYEFLEGGEVFR